MRPVWHLVYTELMERMSSILSDSTVIVMAQSLTGLGHLRVTHALYHGLPPEADPILLSSRDERINILHRISSINPFFRRTLEFIQNGWAEDVFTLFAREYFRQGIGNLVSQVGTILDTRIIRPTTLVIVATHTNLGHQLAAIKKQIERTYKVRMILVVVVTDDSPQHIWAVENADMIIVPSEYTKRKLMEYHRRLVSIAPTQYVVLPYMVSPKLATKLTTNQFSRRSQQLNPADSAPIHVSIPISGAAVQLKYFEKLMYQLGLRSGRFRFHIVSHRSRSTNPFLNRMMGSPSVTLAVSSSHREVVELYEKMMTDEVMALEVTKPSEQAFKALLTPAMRGGSIMLFSQPVGRQEYDNLRFLSRHGLIPTKEQQRLLWALAAGGRAPDAGMLADARSWRGFLLPLHSADSARFIAWALKEKLYASMVHFSGFRDSPELGSDGVKRFWQLLDSVVTSPVTVP